MVLRVSTTKMFQHAIRLGVTKINIHTELCEAALIAVESHTPDESYLALNQRVRAEVKKARGKQDYGLWERWKGGGIRIDEGM